jgi:hypothetical protein
VQRQDDGRSGENGNVEIPGKALARVSHGLVWQSRMEVHGSY